MIRQGLVHASYKNNVHVHVGGRAQLTPADLSLGIFVHLVLSIVEKVATFSTMDNPLRLTADSQETGFH